MPKRIVVSGIPVTVKGAPGKMYASAQRVCRHKGKKAKPKARAKQKAKGKT